VNIKAMVASHGFLVTMEKQITSIQAQQRNRNRVNIHLDGEYAFSLDRVAAAWLSVGQKLTENDIDRLLSKDEYESALGKALRYLSYRSRSRQEMLRYLQKKGYQESLIERIIAYLQAEKLIDDAKFASDWIENRQTFRPRSQRMMKMELRQKGVDDEAISEVFEAAELDDLELALAAGRKLNKRYQKLEKQEYYQKLGAALQRRGFSYSTVKQCLPQLWLENKESEGLEHRKWSN